MWTADEYDLATASAAGTLLWSSTNTLFESSDPDHSKYSEYEILDWYVGDHFSHQKDAFSDDAWRELDREVVRFFDRNEHFIRAAMRRVDGYDIGYAAHDYILTRNGHGAGFWDRGLGFVGDILTTLAQYDGEQEPCIGDDGLIHL